MKAQNNPNLPPNSAEQNHSPKEGYITRGYRQKSSAIQQRLVNKIKQTKHLGESITKVACQAPKIREFSSNPYTKS